MLPQPRPSLPPAPRVTAAIGETAETLRAIRRREVMLAAWARPSPWPGPLPGAPCCFRTQTESLHADDAVAALEVPGGLPQALRADILALARLFCGVIGRDSLRARLDLLDHDACKRFHLDATGYRLLCTYSGRGTQWRPGEPDDGTLPFHEAQPGDVVMLKGRARGGEGLVHRSPPVSSLPKRQRQRLVLCLDEPA